MVEAAWGGARWGVEARRVRAGGRGGRAERRPHPGREVPRRGVPDPRRPGVDLGRGRDLGRQGLAHLPRSRGAEATWRTRTGDPSGGWARGVLLADETGGPGGRVGERGARAGASVPLAGCRAEGPHRLPDGPPLVCAFGGTVSGQVDAAAPRPHPEASRRRLRRCGSPKARRWRRGRSQEGGATSSTRDVPAAVPSDGTTAWVRSPDRIAPARSPDRHKGHQGAHDVRIRSASAVLRSSPPCWRTARPHAIGLPTTHRNRFARVAAV